MKRNHHLLWLLTGLCLMLMPLAGVHAGQTAPIAVPAPGADLWRAVRQPDPSRPGRTQVTGMDSGVLINANGEAFRQYRRNLYIRYAGWALAGAALVLLLFHLLHGAETYRPSGRLVLRFDLPDRIAHWLVAILFLFLGMTGLIMAFGRFVLLPISDKSLFALLAGLSKQGHNLLGPLFVVALLWLVARFMARNWPQRGDGLWLLKGLGFYRSRSVPVGFFNAGEKLWFWLLFLGGAVLSVSGLLLDFPSLAPGRDLLILSLVAHGLAAIALLCLAMGHIYAGSIGVKGSLSGMTRGQVDEAWARAHHDRWLASLDRDGAAHDDPDAAPAALRE